MLLCSSVVTVGAAERETKSWIAVVRIPPTSSFSSRARVIISGMADSMSRGFDDPMRMTSVGGVTIVGTSLRCFEYNLDSSSIAAARGKDDVVRRSGASACAIDAAVSSDN